MPGQDFEAFERIAGHPFGVGEEARGILDIAHSGPQDGALGEGRKQSQGRGGDDPSVPSEPISNCFRSNPRLSFLSTVSASKTEPSASTASIPSTCARIEPWRSTCVPPALVEINPPMVAEPLPPSVSGKRNPAASAAS
jgi:hypothetical protein